MERYLRNGFIKLGKDGGHIKFHSEPCVGKLW